MVVRHAVPEKPTRYRPDLVIWPRVSIRFSSYSRREIYLKKTATEEIHPFPFKIFHRGTVEGSVAKALADYVAEVPDDVQEVVRATHQVLPYIRNFANKDKWHVLIDEDLHVVRYDKHEIPQTHDLITKYLAVRSVNSIYGRVDVIDRDAVEEIAKNEDDDEVL